MLSFLEPDTAKLTDHKRQAQFYVGVADLQAEYGDRGSAARNLVLATSIAKTVGLSPAEMGDSFVIVNAALGHADVALAITASMTSDDSNKWSLMQDIAKAQADSGDFSGAEETAQSIGDDNSKMWAELDIATAQARAKLQDASRTFAAVTAMADRIEDLDKPGEFQSIASQWAEFGDPSDLPVWIERTTDPANQIAICLGAADGLNYRRDDILRKNAMKN